MSAEDRVAYWQRRARDAERQIEYERQHNEHTTEWARNAFAEERRLRDRCTYLYGLAAKNGATEDELRGFYGQRTDPAHEQLAQRVAACHPDEAFSELIHVPNGGSTRCASILLKHITGEYS